MNTKENAPKNTKEEKESIVEKKDGRSNKTTQTKNDLNLFVLQLQ